MNNRLSNLKRRLRLSASIMVLVTLCCTTLSCVGITSSDEPRQTMHERQEAALRDPFSVEAETDRYDITGGDIRTLDRGALRRDLDTVFNP